jgi:Mg2+ and Co2+ transporter CorA
MGGPFGYPLALVLMILTGAMLYMAFKRRRWL